MYIIFDTETTGLPKRWDAPITDTNNWPRCIQLAWQLHDEVGILLEHQDFIIKPEGFNIPYDAEKIHGISTELANENGVSLQEALIAFNIALSKANFVVGQNINFDIQILGCEFHRSDIHSDLLSKKILDTCTEVTASLLQLPGGRGGRFKLPTLTELYYYLFNTQFQEAHNATADVEATSRCFLELIRREVFTKEALEVTPDYFEHFQKHNPEEIKLAGIKHVNLKKASEAIKIKLQSTLEQSSKRVAITDAALLDNVNYIHLHNHTQFSVLQSTISVSQLVKAATAYNMSAVAITDHANLMGAFQFVQDITNYNKQVTEKNTAQQAQGLPPTLRELKPIIGCEFYICDDHTDRSRKDNGYQVVFLAKNKKGYHNLAKMSSIAYTDGFYYVPRIDKNVVVSYKDDLIVLSGNLQGEISSKLLNIGENQAEEALIWWKEVFADDFYLEIMRHGQEDEDRINQSLIALSQKHQVKLVATNNNYYINQTDALSHDVLLCVRDNEKVSTPIGRGRGYRYGLPNQEYYFKSAEQMKALFTDLPEAIINVEEVVSKIECYELAREVLLPKFDIPADFIVEEDTRDGGKRGENKYLRHLTYKGAADRYDELTDEIKERIDFELLTIENSGYPGYFLIVQDFIRAAREMNVSVGPGRGSAAGSVVAYCLGITNINPLKYQLLFERFLNPDRVSLPDIDIDFDDEGRSRVMEYVINKYGAKQVAQIITYGTMAAKSSVKDAARVLDLPLSEAERITKLIPNNVSLEKLFSEDTDQLKKILRPEDFERVKELLELASGDDLTARTLKQAKALEGTLRNTGIHACGVIITPDDISNFIPVATAKDSELFVTQFDNSVVESAGLLKMDFLGLKTLTLIKDTVKLVKYRTGKDLNPDKFPIDDAKTYELFQRGETVGIFQYESPGMQKYMKELKPTVFDDLIAMNALYRPGPIAYIPSFIKRKNKEEEITYDLPACEEFLKETYGITVYQEQVMLLSQKLAGFSKGDADVLRKAMGKKQRDVLNKMKPKFISQAMENGYPEDKLEKIWKDWEAFAEYAFNKSHSTCYAWVAYQTAYLKANFPAEYMAAVLSNNMNDIKQVSFFMEECKRMGLQVLGPDVNESYYKFTVNERYAIRFGIGAVKGVGGGAVETIIENRKAGKYKSIFDLTKRIDLRAANKKTLENLALAGGFDSFQNTHRAQYFQIDAEGVSFLEKAVRFGAKYQDNLNSTQVSLFGETSEVSIAEPTVPACEEWGTMEKLAREREVVGIYISGHPLDDFKHELKNFCNVKLSDLKNLWPFVGRTITFGGILTEVQYKTSKNGKDWSVFTLEGFDEVQELRMFDDDYLKHRHFLVPNKFLFFRCHIKEGWINKETGKRTDPRIQYVEVKQLQDVLESQAKKVTISLNIKDLTPDLIHNLSRICNANKGTKSLEFEILETIQISKTLEFLPQNSENDTNEDADLVHQEPAELEETKLLTRLALPSRHLKVGISPTLISDLEKLDLKFKLN